MLDRKKAIEEYMANAKGNGMKADEETAARIVDKVMENNGFVTTLYDIFWTTIDVEIKETDKL